TRFERPPGDVGNAATFPFPVQYAVVGGADERRVVHQRAEGLLDSFVEAGERLVAMGVGAISTSCGFLALFQRELAERLPVPVAASSLLLIPLIRAMLPGGKRVGILTYAAEALTPAHLTAVGVDPDTPRAGFAPDSA